ncbi:SDR family NAD(P)-dependent oxidoreductase [Sulfidibacter corallicola]|uniref:SDR family NAD(P)-dependent oxidoreductase n=1 Tax=Sulfidibacter corallicola TaxID=2818388 RepID=A0A8A4TQJ3_SULCO|nr:type I polyketide synthase [Sulfidibacter corallicola]QTD52256.1 SDR family NAD(P)-dependent oxidoreductase [Sulfidibacter corallicola]
MTHDHEERDPLHAMDPDPAAEALSPTKRALYALQKTRAQLDALREARAEPIAVIGVGCRFPRQADGPERFWSQIRDGVDATSEVPVDRWDIDAYFDPDVTRPGKMITRRAGFLDDAGDFDPEFFGIAPREAMSIDPQQRLLLEVCWSLMNHAGVTRDDLRTSDTGVYLGICNNDFSLRLAARGPEHIDAYMATGVAHSVAAGRLAYWLGLRGPCLAVDTACSSSLVAVHLAVQALRHDECRTAICGGVNRIFSPELSINFSKNHMLSPDGRCKAFDAEADGFARGEGCGLVMLKRLSHARADGNRILAVIRGTAVNQDGHTSGLTVPNGPAQQDVIRRALADGGVEPHQVDYVEAHGTGTALGDPIEINALAATYGRGRQAVDPLRVGSVKTNIGHLEAAAGVAGLIKAVLALDKQVMPPQLHFQRPNPHIPWSELPIEVVTRSRPWPRGDRPRLAAVSSFGFSGTNAHAVVEEAPLAAEPPALRSEARLLVLSAAHPESLRTMAADHLKVVRDTQPAELDDICFTLAAARSALPWRFACVGRTRDDLITALQALAEDRDLPEHAWLGDTCQSVPAPRRFHFDGAGTGLSRVAARWFDDECAFRESWDHWLDETTAVLPVEDRRRDMVQALESDRPAQILPALFKCHHAFWSVWENWNLSPDAVTGQAWGRVAATCAAGMLSWERGLAWMQRLGEHLEAEGWDALPEPSPALADAIRPLAAELDLTTAVVPLLNVRASFVTTTDWVDWLLEGQVEPAENATLAGLAVPVIPRMPAIEGRDTAEVPASRGSLVAALLARCFVAGATPQWRAWFGSAGTRLRDNLPGYPFRRKPYGVAPASPPPVVAVAERDPHHTDVGTAGLNHPLLGHVIRSPMSPTRIYESHFSRTRVPILEDHLLFGVTVVPGACQIATLLGAGQHAFGREPVHLADLQFLRALSIPDGAGRLVQIGIEPGEEGRAAFRLMSLTADELEEEGVLHTTGRFMVGEGPNPSVETFGRRPIAERWDQFDRELDHETLYHPDVLGPIHLGRVYRWLDAIRVSGNDVFGKISVPDNVPQLEHYPMFPGLIDACVGLMVMTHRIDDQTVLVPFGAETFAFYRRPRGRHLWAQARTRDAAASGGKLIGDIRLVDEDGALICEILGLEGREAHPDVLRRGIQKDLSGWFHELSWQPIAAETETATSVRDLWLICADDGGRGEALARTLEAGGAGVLVACCNGTFDIDDRDRVRLDPLEPEHWTRLLDYAVERCGETRVLRGIVHLWGADLALELDAEPAALRTALARGCGSLLHLVQALGTQRNRHGIALRETRLAIVTEGACALGKEAIYPVQHALWGFGATLAAEHPELRLLRFDLDPADSRAADGPLAAELAADAGETQLAWRDGVRHAARLVRRSRRVDGTGFRAREDGNYLVAGGLGAFGLQIARALVLSGARHLSLVGRSDPGSAAQAVLEELHAMGAQIDVYRADITSFDAISEVVHRAQAAAPLCGVVHAAGVLADGLIRHQSWGEFERVLAPKVLGAANLHLLTRDLSLDFMVACSSMVGLVSLPGQANYAAANAFLDGFMRARAARGLPGPAIAWGPWADTGMVAELADAQRARMQAVGLRLIEPQDGRRALAMALADSSAHLAVIDVDWPRYADKHPGPSGAPFLAELCGSQTETDTPESGWLSRLEAAAPTRRRALLSKLICDEIARVMGLTSGDEVGPRDPVFDLGVDSIMALELQSAIESGLGTSLSSTIIFDFPTVEALVAHLAEDELGALLATPSEQTDGADEGGTLDRMSDDELAKMLADKLDDL